MVGNFSLLAIAHRDHSPLWITRGRRPPCAHATLAIAVARDDHNDATVIDRFDPLIGTVLDGKFLIEVRLATGGFGAIYRARHLASNRELAIKVVHGRFASDPSIVARFQREGATLTTLRCPHTITAYELGETPDGTLYMVMELLHGQSLFDRYAARGRFEWRRMVRIGRAICASLSEAHALGIVHRDLKPTNIHLERVGDDDDFVKVLDFGIAKILQDSRFDSTDLTSAGMMIGTLDYMSPEQMVGGAVTGASDIYTLGIVMYEMIAGRLPFPAATSASTALAAVLKPAPPLSAFAIIPVELERIVMRCLERDLDRRYASIDDVAAALDHVLGPADRGDATRPALVGDDDATLIAKTPVPRLQATPAPAPAAPPAPELSVREIRAVRARTAPSTVVDPTLFDPQLPPGPFDAASSARDAFVRRAVWIIVLSVAAAIGMFAAMHL